MMVTVVEAGGFEGGPFRHGPPPAALVVEAPPLEQLRRRDLHRLVVVLVVVTWSVLAALGRRLARRRGALSAAACDGLVDALIRLGPTHVKLGQIVASSGRLFPAPLVAAARRCLDAVPPFPGEEVRRTVEEDLGAPVDALFASFDEVPLSAASIGQVHACTLPDGREAVVKVQRPGIRGLMATDLRVGFALAGLFERTRWGASTNAREIVRDLHARTFEELTPALEAWRQHQFRQRIGFFGDNVAVTAPEVYWSFCGPRVICMERVHGIPMDRFDELDGRGVDGQAVLRRGAKVWAEAVMVHGPFHGDMHAGNIWALHDGRTCFLDFGIMGELPDDWKQVLKDLFYTCAFDQDFRRVAAAYRRVGALPPGAGSDEELADFMRGVLGSMLVDGFGSIDIVALVNSSLDLLKGYGAALPRELVLIAKQLLYVDRYTKHLAPEYSITADPYVVKNIFPAEAKVRAAELGIDLDDPLPS